jgi:hypothetical protein
MIATDQFYYYRSAAGREIDLVFEVEDTVYAVEIKATKRPGPRDSQNLKHFEDSLKRPIKRFPYSFSIGPNRSSKLDSRGIGSQAQIGYARRLGWRQLFIYQLLVVPQLVCPTNLFRSR